MPVRGEERERDTEAPLGDIEVSTHRKTHSRSDSGCYADDSSESVTDLDTLPGQDDDKTIIDRFPVETESRPDGPSGDRASHTHSHDALAVAMKQCSRCFDSVDRAHDRGAMWVYRLRRALHSLWACSTVVNHERCGKASSGYPRITLVGRESRTPPLPHSTGALLLNACTMDLADTSVSRRSAYA